MVKLIYRSMPGAPLFEVAHFVVGDLQDLMALTCPLSLSRPRRTDLSGVMCASGKGSRRSPFGGESGKTVERFQETRDQFPHRATSMH